MSVGSTHHLEMVFVWKQNYILVDEYFFFCCTWIVNSADNIRYAADRFAPHGKRILVEALSPGVKPHYLFSSQYQALAIVEEVARDNVFIQLDTFHAQKVDGNLTHLIRDYAGKYAHVQIAGLPDRHEPDDGEINYPWLFRLFDEVGYQGWIGCEYKPRGLTEEGLGWFDAWR